MAEPEREIGQIVEEAKNQVVEKIKKAESSDNPEKAKEELGEELRERLKNLKLAAEEATEEEIKIAQGRRLVSQKNEEKKAVLVALTSAVEAARHGIRVSATDQGQKILEKIAQTGQYLTPAVAVAIEHYFYDYFLGEKEIVAQGKINQDFIESFKELATTNIVAANFIKETLYQVAEKGEIPGLTREVIDQNLISRQSEEKKSHLTEEDLEKRKKIYKKLVQTLQKKGEQLASLPDDQRKEVFKNIELINTFLLSGELTSKEIEAASALGISLEEIREFASLSERLKGVESYGILEQYAAGWVGTIREAQAVFSKENLSTYFETDSQGKLRLSREKRLEIKNLIRKYYYRGLEKIHEQSSETYHTVLGEHQDIQYYLIMLHQVIDQGFEPIKDLFSPYDEEDRKILGFLNDVTGNFQMRITHQAQIFHDMPLFIRDLSSVEKLIEFFKYAYPTQLAEIFDEEEGKTYMTVARDLMTMMLREYLVIHNNIYDGSLLSGEYDREGVIWKLWFKEEYAERLRKVLAEIEEEEGREFLERNDWIIKMISTYTEGIGIATLIDGEVLATSDPVGHFREVHPLMSLLSAKHNWLVGRGKKAPGLITKYLLSMPVTLYPEKKSLLRRIIKSGWHPEKIAAEIDKDIEFYGGVITESLFKAGDLYQELLSMFNLPNSISSWDGWRIELIPENFKKLYEDIFKKSIGKDASWQDVFDTGFKLYGTSFLWWSIKGGPNRLKNEIESRLRVLGFDEETIKRLQKDKVLERSITSNFDGKRTTLNYLEFEQLKLDQRRADLYFRYLRRNPGDFLAIFHQLCPEAFSYDKKADWKSVYLFDERFAPGKSDSEIERELSNEGKKKDEIRQFLSIRRNFLTKWGGSFSFLKSFNQWIIKDVVTRKEFFDDKGRFDKTKFFKKFIDASTVAYERVKKRNEQIRQQILSEKIPPEEKAKLIKELNPYVTEQDFAGFEDIWQLFAGDHGFFEALIGVELDQADSLFEKFGGGESEGVRTIFFDMAHNWNLSKGEINPFAADFPYYEVFNAFKMAGESTIKRTFEANVVVFKEVISKLGNLEELLENAAKTGSVAEIETLHKQIYSTLSGLVGQEYAWRANYILSQIVAGFFAEHNIARSGILNWAGPLGWVARMMMGQRKISLSRLLTKNPYAHTMDTNALRTYFLNLKYNNLINPEEKGIWGFDQLNQVFEAGNKEFILGDVVPKVLWSIVIFMLLIYLRKAFEEAEGKKKQ